MDKFLVFTLLAFSSMSTQAAEPVVSAHTELKDCVIQEVLPGKDMTGAYMRIVHQGAPVDVIKAEVPSVSGRIELHSMAMKNGVMHMVPLTNARISAGERVFKKGGDHVMLFDVTSKPAVGSQHAMTLFFSDNTQASCNAVVKSLQDVMKDAGINPHHAAASGKH